MRKFLSVCLILLGLTNISSVANAQGLVSFETNETNSLKEKVVTEANTFYLQSVCDLYPYLESELPDDGSTDFIPEEESDVFFPDEGFWAEEENPWEEDVLFDEEGNGPNQGWDSFFPRPIAKLTDILSLCERLQKGIVWTDGKGTTTSIANWSDPMKNRINEIFEDLYMGERDLGIKCVDPKKAYCNSQDCDVWGRPFISKDEAFDIYAAHVAHILYLEVFKLLPWSIQSRRDGELREMLDSRRYFARILKTSNYRKGTFQSHIEPERDFTILYEQSSENVLICDPRDGYDFLNKNNLLGLTPEETIQRVSYWFHENVSHEHREFNKTHPDHLKHIGDVNTLAMRLEKSHNKNYVPANLGCHGAADMMRDIARSVNIPLLRARVPDPSFKKNQLNGILPLISGSHGALCMNWESSSGRCLMHVDDIYAQMGKKIKPVDNGKLLSDAQDIQQHFFDATWNTLDFMKISGFNFKLQTVEKGKGYGRMTQGIDYLVNFGYILGEWQMSDRGKAAYSKSQLKDIGGGQKRYDNLLEYNDIWNRYIGHYHYELVPHDTYLKSYCAAKTKMQKNADYCANNFKKAVYDYWMGVLKSSRDACLAKAGTAADKQKCLDEFNKYAKGEYDRLQRETKKCQDKYMTDANIDQAMTDATFYNAMDKKTLSSSLNLGFQPTKDDVLKRLKFVAKETQCKL